MPLRRGLEQFHLQPRQEGSADEIDEIPDYPEAEFDMHTEAIVEELREIAAQIDRLVYRAFEDAANGKLGGGTRLTQKEQEALAFKRQDELWQESVSRVRQAALTELYNLYEIPDDHRS